MHAFHVVVVVFKRAVNPFRIARASELVVYAGYIEFRGESLNGFEFQLFRFPAIHLDDFELDVADVHCSKVCVNDLVLCVDDYVPASDVFKIPALLLALVAADV
jgi:hypothetical protein